MILFKTFTTTYLRAALQRSAVQIIRSLEFTAKNSTLRLDWTTIQDGFVEIQH